LVVPIAAFGLVSLAGTLQTDVPRIRTDGLSDATATGASTTLIPPTEPAPTEPAPAPGNGKPRK
jgi:hypothetical protein